MSADAGGNNAVSTYRLRHRVPAEDDDARAGNHDRPGPRRTPCCPRQPWRISARPDVAGSGITPAAGGLTLEGGRLTAGNYQPITVSRRISAPAGEIFQILADPRNHLTLDGSGMLREVASGTVIRGVGDVFVMRMYFIELGDYQMINHVVEFEPGRRIGWEPEAGRGHPNAEPGAERPAQWGQRWSFELTPDGPESTIVTEIFDCSQVPEDQRVDIDYGNIWVQSMRRTLERLDQICAGSPREKCGD